MASHASARVSLAATAVSQGDSHSWLCFSQALVDIVTACAQIRELGLGTLLFPLAKQLVLGELQRHLAYASSCNACCPNVLALSSTVRALH